MKFFKIFVIFLIFNCILSSENFSLIFPFTTIEKDEPELNTSYNDKITNEIMRNIYMNELFLKIEIGSPPQKLNLRVSVNSNDFFISKEDAAFEKDYPKKKQSSFYYNPSISSKFQYQKNKTRHHYFSHTHESEYVMDNIKLISTNKKNEEININQFEFFLASKVNGPNHGIIGLKNYPYVEYRYDFFSTLKKHNLIKNKIWFFDFDKSNSKGSLIIGNYPHFDNNLPKTGKYKIFDLNHFEKIYSIIKNEKWDTTWGLNFSKIYLQNISTSEFNEILNTSDSYKNVVLNPNFGVIIGSHHFKFILEKTFLNKFLNEKICWQPVFRIRRNYEEKLFYYYYCKSSYIEQMKKEFNPIIFEHKEFRFNFSLEFDDLYVQKNQYIFLRLIFDEYSPSWIFGSPFFSKYSLFFDSDSKEIGFYSPNINHNNLNENLEVKHSRSVINVVLHVLFAIILIVIGIYLGKKIYGLKRKLRANELEEKFEYKPAEKQLQIL